jgi:hypothetical protein
MPKFFDGRARGYLYTSTLNGIQEHPGEQEQTDLEEIEELNKIRNLEKWSAIFSAIAIVVGIVMLTAHSTKQTLWWTVIQLAEPSFNESSTVKAYFDTWESVCPAYNKFPVDIARTFENSESKNEVHMNIVVGQEQWEKWLWYHPIGMLIWIFVVSFTFQGSRSDLWPARVVGDWLGLFDGNVANRSVEFSRWLEYALTSPLQIWLVYSSFFMGDFSILLYAALSQAGLVLLGALIEHFYYKACKKHIKKNEKKKTFFYRCAKWVTLLTWIIHILIWIPIFVTFVRLDGQFENCYDFGEELLKNWRDVKWIVYVIIITQFILFSSFGVVITNRLRCEWPENKKEIKRRNRHDAKYYAWLSVTAKTVLDIFFIVLMFRFKQVESKA